MDIAAVLSRFPLHTRNHVATVPATVPAAPPTLWIAPPRDTAALLSADVECLKWQAYLALRGISAVALRCDISPEGAPDARLPVLHIQVPPRLLPPRAIPAWADAHLHSTPDPLDGYRDLLAKHESHAWIALLEGVVHAALSLAVSRPLDTTLSPPPPPSTGFTSLLPPFGANVDPAAVHVRYAEAIAALSDRLASDKWFLGSVNPTALDALVFAYLHTLLHCSESTRIQVTRRPNLVAWERSVRSRVQAAFCPAPAAS